MARKEVGYVELRWTCPNCSGVNAGRARVCATCGAPMPQDVKFEQAAHQELIADEAAKAEAKAGADIHCPYCGTRNPASAKVCSQCSGDLSGAAARASGEVVGAFSVGQAVLVKCPRCGAENPETSLNCAQCGSGLKPESAPPLPATSQAETPPRKTNPLVWVAIAAVVLLVCGAVGYLLFMGSKTEATTGVVSRSQWERSIQIEGLVPVEYSDWQDEVPEGAELGSCSQELRSVQDSPAPNAVEVCGTPYTIDIGSGIGQVVQDCQYEVYDDRCSFTVEEWRQVDIATVSGTDANPVWPEPVLEEGQRLGERRNEVYTIVFTSGGETYTYTTRDTGFFQQAQRGSQWTLNINSFGNLVSVEP